MSLTLKFAVLCIVALSVVSALRSQQEVNRDWQLFKTKYAKTYASDDEERYRFHIFAKNMFTAKQSAAANPLAQFGVSPYADLAPEEFARRKTSVPKQRRAAPAKDAPAVSSKLPAAPSKVDWRTKGAVNKVWNQGQCGDGWAFAISDNVASLSFVQGGKTLPELSAQYIVSCDATDYGCNGGTLGATYTWLSTHNNGQLPPEKLYPYASGNGSVPACNNKTEFDNSVQVVGSFSLETSESQMTSYVAEHGPIVVGVDATSWQTYTGGVLTNCIGNQIDHAVLAVGYDLSHTPPYWILKNSWSAEWGEEGYIRVKYGVNSCLIKNDPISGRIK